MTALAMAVWVRCLLASVISASSAATTLGLHSFDPQTLSILYAVFDDRYKELSRCFSARYKVLFCTEGYDHRCILPHAYQANVRTIDAQRRQTTE
jgi:hypothetical protein